MIQDLKCGGDCTENPLMWSHPTCFVPVQYTPEIRTPHSGHLIQDTSFRTLFLDLAFGDSTCAWDIDKKVIRKIMCSYRRAGG